MERIELVKNISAELPTEWEHGIVRHTEWDGENHVRSKKEGRFISKSGLERRKMQIDKLVNRVEEIKYETHAMLEEFRERGAFSGEYGLEDLHWDVEIKEIIGLCREEVGNAGTKYILDYLRNVK